ncbi:MAG: TetR/AcrR family transcriptional regulator [Caldisericia bacterium]|nr:TetR/AcrR family transcriptional regulator [Caldisericia bacterium]
MNEKRLKGESTKRKIVDVATNLFNENGYDATSIQDICNRAEISKGAFFHHFPTKEYLFLEILNEFLEDLNEKMRKIEKKSNNIPQAMLEMTEILKEIFEISEGKFSIFLEFLRRSSKNEEIMNKLSTNFIKYENYVENLIERGKKEKTFDEKINSKFISSLIVSLAIGVILRKSLFKDKNDLSKDGIIFLLNSIKRRS